MNLTEGLRAEYQHLWDTMIVLEHRKTEVQSTAGRITINSPRYKDVAGRVSPEMPWQIVGIIHALECSLNFRSHLHNGDPLTARTVHVPRGRPTVGNPPFKWEDSAHDALEHDGWGEMEDWSIPALLHRLEGYNGYGYLKYHADVLSPYIWSFSNHYHAGKYGSDGKFDPSLVSKQCGAAPLLKMLGWPDADT